MKIDYLHDKANRIGALVMHLAAAEVLSGLLLRIGTLMPKKKKMGRSFRFGSRR
jgi:hypothetical protein